MRSQGTVWILIFPDKQKKQEEVLSCCSTPGIIQSTFELKNRGDFWPEMKEFREVLKVPFFAADRTQN